MTRLVLALLALAALCVPAAAGAATPTVTVLNGGKITYSGSANWKSSTTTDDVVESESASFAWNTEYVAHGMYDDDTWIVLGDNGRVPPLSWTRNLGSGSATHKHRYWDSRSGTYKWTPTNTCTATYTEHLDPPNSLHWDTVTGGRTATVFGTQSVDDEVSCALPDEAGGPPWTHDVITAIAQRWNAGTQPATGTVTRSVSFGRSDACGPGCTKSYDGGGEMKLECLLCVTNIRFEHPDLPGGGLKEVPDEGTTDGNPVRITATIVNRSDRTFTSSLQWRERTSGRRIYNMNHQAPQLVTFPAGQTKTVEVDWLTDGFAWEKGKPQIDREVEVLTALGGGRRAIKVLPKPMVLVHGWNSDAATWDAIKPFVESSLSEGYRGRVVAVGDGRHLGTMNTDADSGKPIEFNAREMNTYVEDVRADLDAFHVDLVAHSMGGLISRFYIQERMPEPTDFMGYPELGTPVARHLVMIGTPNQGSPCADLISMAKDGIPTWQLRTDFARDIVNKHITQERGVRFSVIAGNWRERTCQSPRFGDLVVELPSAWHTYTDIGETFINHLDMTASQDIFTTWVKPRVALDPDKAIGGLPLAPRARAAGVAAAEAPAAEPAEQQGVLSRQVDVPADGVVEVPVPVSGATALTVGFTAPPGVASALVRPDGSVADTVAAGSDAAKQPLRFHRAEAPEDGTWRLRLAQTGAGAAARADVVAAVEGSALRLRVGATQPAGGGPVSVEATVTGGGADTVVATVRGEDGTEHPVTLTGAGDGRYTGATAALPAGTWAVRATATSGGATRIAATVTRAGVASGGDHGGGGDEGSGSGSGSGGGETGAGSGPTAGGPATTTGARSGAVVATRSGAAAPTAAPARIAATVSRPRDARAPFAWTVSGRVTGGRCAGTVAVELRRGTARLWRGRSAVGRDCRFRVRVPGGRRRGARTITLRTASATATLKVRAG